MNEKGKLKHIIIELSHHLPFSIFGVCLGLILVGILTFISILVNSEQMFAEASHELFHVFHPVHILLSAVATTAMFWKHERNLFKAIIVGYVGSISICGASDIIFPYIGGVLIGAKMHMHICIIEHPGLIINFASLGVLAGFFVIKSIEHSTEYSHSAHVFISSAASILYLLAYGVGDWIHSLGSIFLITIFAVMIPCCLSDIVFPLACSHNACNCEINKK